MSRVDVLLAQIEQVLAECDAGQLPPLMSASALVDEPAKACGGVVSGMPVLVDEPGPPAFVMPADRGSSAVQYVGFDVEPRANQMRGWLTRWINRAVGR